MHVTVLTPSASDVAPQSEMVLSAATPKRRPKVFGRRWSLLLAFTDLCMFLLAALFAVEIVSHGTFSPHPGDSFVISTAAFALVWFLIFERLGLYRRSYALSMRDELYYTTAALALGALPQLTLFTIVPSVSSSRLVLLLSLAFAVATVGGSRAVLHELRKVLGKRFPQRVAIIGDRNRVRAALASLNFSENTRVLTLVADDVEETLSRVTFGSSNFNDVPWLRQARAWGCDSILLTEVLPPAILPLLLEVTSRENISLAFAPPRLCAHAYEYGLRTDGHQALIVPLRLGATRPFARFTKRMLDVIIASAALVVAAPFILFATIAILIESGRPIFFTQERVGFNGRIFKVLKFRSMREDAESKTGPVWAKRGDDRTTKLGSFLRRTSIDELPQIFNVLRGEMSLVGPRPERPVFVELFRRQLPRYDERHLVRPGITGWSQVHMKRVLDVSDVSEKLSHDLFYVENWSFYMDASVIVKTGFEFLFHRAA
jgi:exopolysaccharide biosynthesis polyprenyl glycosylphosphotransferase